MAQIIVKVLIIAVGLWVATILVPGMEVDSNSDLLWAAIALGVINVLVKPLIVLLTLPVSVLTLGLFLLIINAAMLNLADWFVDGLHVEGFFSALFGAIIVSVVSWAANAFIGAKES